MLLSLWISMLSLRNLSESQIWRTLVAQRQQPGTSYARIRLESWNRRSNNRWLAYRNSIFPHDGKLLALIWVRKSPAPTWLALLGTAAVLAFVLIRAASLHHIDRFIGQRILGLTWNWVLEMGGISLVLVASEWRRLNLNTRSK